MHFIVLYDDKLVSAVFGVYGFWFLVVGFWLGYFKFHSHFTHFCSDRCFSLGVLVVVVLVVIVVVESHWGPTLVCFLVNFGPYFGLGFRV